MNEYLMIFDACATGIIGLVYLRATYLKQGGGNTTIDILSTGILSAALLSASICIVKTLVTS